MTAAEFPPGRDAMSLADSRIYVAGHRGLVGAALVRALEARGAGSLILRTHRELDLLRQSDVERFFDEERPDFVFAAAARVGGIHANATYPASFIHENLCIQTNLIGSACQAGVKRLLFLGSSCIYPKFAPQPMTEDALLTGPLEPTNAPYAIAKIAGIMECQAFNSQYGTKYISVMPTNLYGPGDNFDLENSHVLPALIRRFHEARQREAPSVTIWGTGRAMREFLHVDDLADACLFLMSNYEESEIINVGTGEEISIAGLASMVSEVVGYNGALVFDSSRPDGTPRKLLNISRLHRMGWRHRIGLREGIAQTYRWYLDHEQDILKAGRACPCDG